ncbi:MAG: nucleoside deaminase [Candidatus Sericytochromatia bacterium]
MKQATAPPAGMLRALELAQEAAAAGEVPIAAVLMLDGQIKAEAANTCLASAHPLQHAEMRVLQAALSELSQPDMRRACLYVTLEPCPMCMGAILHSHLGHLSFGAYNLKWGCCGTVADFRNWFPAEQLEILGGICEVDCTQLLTDFFQGLRQASVSPTSPFETESRHA